MAAAFVASHKTLAFGMPLLATLFSGDPSLGLLTLPLLVLHPMQLLVGGFLVPTFQRYTAEYPSYASPVLLNGVAGAGGAAFDNPSAYSDRSWAILQKGATSSSQ